MRKILVISSSYTLQMIKERKLEGAVLARDINGYFDHVFSVHPFADIIDPKGTADGHGKITKTEFLERHTIIEGRGGKFTFLGFIPPLNFIVAQMELVFNLWQLVLKEKINVIRCDDPQYIGFLGFLLSRMSNVPYVVRIGSNWDKYYEETGKTAMPRLFKERRVEKKLERFVFKRADLVAGANLDNLNYAIASGARKEFTTLFRYGNLVHPSHWAPPDQRPSADDILRETGLSRQKFIIYIGRLEPVKLPDHILLTAAELKKRGHGLKALMVGGGSMMEELTKKAKELGIEKDVVFAGNRDQEWIARVLPHAAFVLSPHTGRALTEAALSGVPMVGYDIDWQSELIKTAQTGELVGYKNWTAMADAVTKMLRDPDYSRRMGANVRKAAMEMMDPVRLNEHEKNEYNKLLARGYARR